MFYILLAIVLLLSLSPALSFPCSKNCSQRLVPITFSDLCICLAFCTEMLNKKQIEMHAKLWHTCTHILYRPHYLGPRDLCRNYFLFWPREKGEVVRMKRDVTTGVVFLCALLVPGCEPGFSWVGSAIFGLVLQNLCAVFACKSQIAVDIVSFKQGFTCQFVFVIIVRSLCK